MNEMKMKKFYINALESISYNLTVLNTRRWV